MPYSHRTILYLPTSTQTLLPITHSLQARLTHQLSTCRKQTSFLQYLEQPSPSTSLPSSHSSPIFHCFLPSPQYCTFHPPSVRRLSCLNPSSHKPPHLETTLMPSSSHLSASYAPSSSTLLHTLKDPSITLISKHKCSHKQTHPTTSTPTPPSCNTSSSRLHPPCCRHRTPLPHPCFCLRSTARSKGNAQHPSC